MIIVSEEGTIVNFDNIDFIECKKTYIGEVDVNEEERYDLLVHTNSDKMILLGEFKTEEEAEKVMIDLHEQYLSEKKFERLSVSDEEQIDSLYNEFSILYINNYKKD